MSLEFWSKVKATNVVLGMYCIIADVVLAGLHATLAADVFWDAACCVLNRGALCSAGLRRGHGTPEGAARSGRSGFPLPA